MYLSDEVTKYTYLDAASAGLSDVSAGEARFAFADGTLRAEGLAPGPAVIVYGVDGILVSSGTADQLWTRGPRPTGSLWRRICSEDPSRSL